jgi:RimJ/RimL family protein N-acetyltransferase
MKLAPLEASDLSLFEKLFTDPIYMADLGGPQPVEKVPGILERQTKASQSGNSLVFKIILEVEDWRKAKERRTKNGSDSDEFTPFFDYEAWKDEWSQGVGSVCYWRYSPEEEYEIGYGVLPKYQNFGFTTIAVKLLLEKARENRDKWGERVHIYTSCSNKSSNRLCEKLDCTFIETKEIDYDDRKIPANHYLINL